MTKNNKTLSLDQVPACKRKEAERRLKIIQGFEPFRNQRNNRKKSWTAAIKEYAASKNVADTTLRRWRERYQSLGLIGLVDTRGYGGDGDAGTISQGAFELFKTLFLLQEGFSLRLCWRIISYINKTEKRGWTIPCLTAMYNYCHRHIPEPVLTLRREGQAACKQRYGSYLADLVARDEGLI